GEIIVGFGKHDSSQNEYRELSQQFRPSRAQHEKTIHRKYSRSLSLIGPSRKTAKKEKGSSLEFRLSWAQPPMLM
ncbi:12911_t:CDS:2, partial [Acaulospora morrowiae]